MRTMSIDAFALRDAKVLLPFALGGFAIFFLLQLNVVVAAGALILVGVLALMLRRPELGAAVALFAIYSNIAVLAMRSERAVQTAAGSAGQNPRIAMVLAAVSLLLLVPLVHQTMVRRQKLIFDRGFVLMLVLVAALLASSFFARDWQIAESQVADYLLEGLVPYFLLTNVIRDFSTLKRVTWSLLLAGSLMGGLTLYQRATHTEEKIYGGLAQMGVDITLSENGQERSLRPVASTEENGQTRGQLRAAGPIGEPNRYAQILLVLLPLAALTFRMERSRRLQALGLATGALILGGLLLTFSRSAILAGCVLFAIMAYLRLLKPRQALVSGFGLGVVTLAFAPGVVGRLATLENLKSLVLHTDYTYRAPDSSAVHRYVLNSATWHVFLDHPILGVGPGHFAEYYAIPYSNRVGLIETRKKYRGHNLYLETLAETGVIGFVSLLAIPFVVMRELWKEHRSLEQTHPELRNWAGAFFLCLCGYAITAIFDHLSYQRYFWLLVAVCSAAARIVRSERNAQDVKGSFSFQGV